MAIKVALLGWLSLFCGALWAEEVANIELIAFNCFTCHGEDGRSQGAAPALRGLPGKYVQQTLEDYRASLRPGTIMPRIAKAYTSSEIKALAEYFAQFKQ